VLSEAAPDQAAAKPSADAAARPCETQPGLGHVYLSGGQKLFLLVVLDIFSRRMWGGISHFDAGPANGSRPSDSELQAEFPPPAQFQAPRSNTLFENLALGTGS
jgi:hypothetical protein